MQPYINDVLKVCSNIIAKDHYSKNKDKALQIADQVRVNAFSMVFISTDL